MNYIQNKKSSFKTILLFVLAVMFAFCGASFFNVEQKQESTRAADVLAISSADDLVAFANKVNSGTTYSGYTVYLTKEIDLSGKVWTPIGSYKNIANPTGKAFSGEFDGNGYNITGLTINSTLTLSDGVGLFGYIKNATVRNVTLKGIDISVSNSWYVGGIIGKAESSTISDCASFGSVTETSGSHVVGGIVGYADDTTIQNSYSYSSVNGKTSGGIVGQTEGTSKVKKCFYNGSSVVGSSKAGGIVGYLYGGTVTDVYSTLAVYSGKTDKYIKTDNSNWVTDTNGAMMGYHVSNTVLKGVGNITVKLIKRQFSASDYKYPDSPTSEEKLIYSTVTLAKADNSKTDKDLDIDSKFYAVNDSKLYNFTKISVTRDNGVVYGNPNNSSKKSIFSTSNSYAQYPSASSDSNLAGVYKKAAYIDFKCNNTNWTSSWDTTGTDVKYSLSFNNNCQGFYTIDVYVRGVWRQVDASTVIYSSPDKTTLTTTSKIATTVELKATQFTEKTGTYSASTAWTNTNTTSSGVRTFFVPYNEAYDITFSAAASYSKYLGTMQGYWMQCSNTEANVSDMTANLTRAAYTALKNNSYKQASNIVTDSVNDTTKTVLHNFYFDNAQKVTLNINKNDSYANVSKNSPVFYSTKSSNAMELSVLIGENVSSKKIAYNNGSSLTKISRIEKEKDIYPTWSKFVAKNIVDKDGTVIAQNGSTATNYTYGGNITYKSHVFYPEYETEGDTSSACNWNVNWATTKETVTVKNGLETNNSAAVGVYLASAKSKVGSTETDLKTAQKTFDILSNQGVTFTIEPHGGFELASFTITPTVTGQTAKTVTATGSNSYTYYGCTYTQKISVGSVTIDYNYSYTLDSNIYTITLTNAIGIESIDFTYKPKTFKDCEIKTSIDATIMPDKSPLDVAIAKKGETVGSGTPISTTKTLKTDIRFYDTYVIQITDIAKGYYVTGINIDIKSQALTGNLPFNAVTEEIEGDPHVFEITFDIANNAINNFDITINVAKNKTIFNIKVDGVKFESAPDPTVFGIKYSITNELGTTESKSGLEEMTGKEAYTGDLVAISLKMPSWVTLKTKDYGTLDTGATKTESEPTGEYNFVVQISNFAHEDGTEVTITFTLEVQSTKISMDQQKDEKSENKFDAITIKYCGEIRITKSTSKLSVNIYDPHTDTTTLLGEFEIDMSSISKISIKLSAKNSSKTVDLGDITTATTNKSMNKGLSPTIDEWFDNENEIVLEVNLKSIPSYITIGETRISNGTNVIGDIVKISESSVDQGDTITATAETPVGYSFLGWSMHTSSDNAFNPKGAGKNIAYTTEEINLCLNAEKPGFVKLDYYPYVHIIAVYEAKIYKINFNKTVTDTVRNQNLTTSLSSETEVKLEYAKSYGSADISKLPTLNIDGMYNFTGWQIFSGNNIIYSNGWTTTTFIIKDEKGDKLAVDDVNNTITFYPLYTEKVAKINLYVDGTDSGYDGKVTYGTNSYDIDYTPSKPGYNFTGWRYASTKYVPYGGTALEYKLQLTEVNFEACFEEKSVTLKISAGENGQKFPNGKSTIEGSIKIGQNNITANSIFDENFNLTAVPTWTTDFATFEFRCFIFGSTDKPVIPTNYANNNFTTGKTSYTFTASEIDNGNITITAYYEMIDFKKPTIAADTSDKVWAVSGGVSSFIYDGKSHNIKVTVDNKASSVLGFTYSWSDGSTSDVLSLTKVAHSGDYVCTVTATPTPFNAYGSVESDSNTLTVTINQKELEVTQSNIKISTTNPITKVFDNTTKIEAEDNVSFTGVCGSDVVVLELEFTDINVGNYSSMFINLSGTDADNYFVDENKVCGKITQYELNLELVDDSDNYVYKIGSDSKQVDIKNKYKLVDEDASFLTKNSLSFDFTLKTNRNVTGDYTQDSSKNYFVTSITVGASGASSGNFTLVVDDTFKIVDADSNSIIFNAIVKTNDKTANETVDSSIAILTITNALETSTGNKTSEFTLIETKDYFGTNKNLPIALTIQSAYSTFYRVEGWKVLVDGSEQTNNFAQNLSATYTITNTNVSQITIYVYITRLKEITFNYNLADASEVDNQVSSTKVSIGETIKTSVLEYGATFPTTISRTGWTFTGWKVNGTEVKESTVWSFQGSVLEANWAIAEITVDKVNQTLEYVYDGDNHAVTISVTNQNTLSLSYSYSWTTTATTAGTYSDNTLTVKDVKNNGTYTLTITAKGGSLSRTLACKVVVKVDKFQIFNTGFEINKQYDATADVIFESVDGAKSEKIFTTGSYKATAAGSLINKDSLIFKAYIGSTEVDINNYKINTQYISANSKITPRDIELNAGELSKNYSRSDKTVLSLTGTYTFGKINFDYRIETPSANVGTYKNEQLVIVITKGDIKSNFNFKITGTFTIGKEVLGNDNVTWIGETKVTFDGKTHSLVLQTELQDIVKSYTYINVGTNETLDTQSAIYAGTYRVKVNIVDTEINYQIAEGGLYTTLVIEKRAISVSYTGTQFKKQYDGTTDISALNGTVANVPTGISDEYKPTIKYQFVTSYAEANKEIRAYLDPSKKVSESYILSQESILGDITKIKTDITVKATKTYDGSENFMVNVDKQITATNLLSNEDLSGYINFIVKDCLENDNTAYTSGLEYEIVLSIGSYAYDTNYEINSLTYEIYITKADIMVTVTNDDNYIYSGEEVKFVYAITRVDNAIGSLAPKTVVITYEADTATNSSTVLDSGKAVQVGSYYYNISFTEEDAKNFKFNSNSNIRDKFNITPRSLIVNFQKNIAYTGSNITYTSVDYPEDKILVASTPLGTDDVIAWEYETIGVNVGAYYIRQEGQVTVKSLEVYKNGVNYTRNYTFQTNTNSAIFITQQEIDFSQLEFEGLTTVYSASTKTFKVKAYNTEEEFTYDKIIRENITGKTQLNSPDEIFYAGTYSLTIKLNNYIIKNNRPVVFTIAPFDVDINPITEKIVKAYDGSTSVTQSYITLKEGFAFFNADSSKIKVVGNYNDKNVGNNKTITYSLSCSNQLILCSYNLLTTSGSGNIIPKDIVLSLVEKHSVYYTGNEVDLQASQFTVYGLVGTDTLIGTMTLKQKNAGVYQLNTYKQSIVLYVQIMDISGDSFDATNYNVTFATDANTAVHIKHAEVEVVVKNLEKIYNGSKQEPTFEYAIYSGHGEIVNDFKTTITYKNASSEVVDPNYAGEYTIVVGVETSSNYRLVTNTSGTLAIQRTLADKLIILKRKLAVDVKTVIERQFTGAPAEYQVVNADVYDPSIERSNGLVEGHVFSAILYTNSEMGGTYTINGQTGTIGYKDIKVQYNSTDLTANYEVVAYKATIIITELGENFETSSIENLVYDGYDKIEKGLIKIGLMVNGKLVQYVYGVDNIFSDLKLNGEATTKVVEAGDYSFVASVTINSVTKTETLEFTVAKKLISSVSIQENKQYDSTVNVLGEITSNDICVVNGTKDDVTITAVYIDESSANTNVVGKHKIKFTLSGTDRLNYDISQLLITGEISARELTIGVKSSYKPEFTNKTQTIDYTNLVITSGTIVDTEVMSGSILFTQIKANKYSFVSENINADNLKITTATSKDVTNFYKFIYTGDFEIIAKNVILDIQTIDLTYNAEIQKIDSFIVLTNVAEDLTALAKQNINISYNDEVLNAATYTATISSKSTDFIYTVNGYVNNIIPFVVKVRDIRINIGNVVYEYNPTSNYLTNLKNSDVENIVSTQNISGTYKLYQSGLDVGKYSGDNIIFSDVAIYVNGVNIINTNYNITGYTGTVEITPFIITEDNVYLVKSVLTYSKTDAINLIELAFVDANNQTQIIRKNKTDLGNFVINEGEAINVGEYTVTATIKNCTLVNNTLGFSIIPLEITKINFIASKQFDGTEYVLNSIGSNLLTSNQVLAGDTIVIKGAYYDKENKPAKNVGKYTIEFTIDDADKIPQKNYSIVVSSEGSIVKRDIELSIDGYKFVYQSTGIYTLEYNKSNFKVTFGSLVTDNSFTGYITTTKVNYIGSLDVSNINIDNLRIVNTSEEDLTDNYEIDLVGKVSVIKAIVSVDFGTQTEFVYSATNVVIVPVITLKNSTEEVLPSVATNYKSDKYNSATAPINVGEYVLTLTLSSSCYEFESNNTFNFKIVEYEIELTEDDILKDTLFKIYGDEDPEIIMLTITTPLQEIVNLTFTRDLGEDVGKYNIYLNSWNNANYAITLATGAGNDAFEIKKAGLLKVEISNIDANINALTKVYDTAAVPTVNISDLIYISGGEVLSGSLVFENGTSVGSYSLLSWSITSANYESFEITCELDYVITQKVIYVSSEDATKPYDNSTAFFGNIKILDQDNVELSSVYPLVVTGEYTQKFVGENINVSLTFTGDSIENYDLKNTLSGSIRKRNIIITPTSEQACEYGVDTFDILYTITDNESGYEFYGELSDEITGSLNISKFGGLSKYIAGDYKILNGLSANYLEIEFVENVIYKINKKELIITNSENFEKVYDGNANVIGEFEIEGKIEGDIVTVTAKFYDKDLIGVDASVSDNKIVKFDLKGADAINYFVQNVAGAIKNKIVNMVFNYSPKEMFNEELIEQDSEDSIGLIYGLPISDTIMALPEPMHEGYEFKGWFFDLQYTKPITIDTVIDGNNDWAVEETEKTVFAKWEIKKFKVELIGTTRVNGVYTTDEGVQGGSVTNINGNYNYCDVIDLKGLTQVKDGYEFIGYSDDLLTNPNEEYLTSGWVVAAKENYIYAKFKPLTVTLTLNANGGTFTKVAMWEFNTSVTTAEITVEFNQSLEDIATTLPSATKKGYSQDTTIWKDEDGNIFNLTSATKLNEIYFPETTLYVVWTAERFDLTLNANGGYFVEYNASVWTAYEKDANDNIIKLTKKVTFDEEIGDIAVPYRKGWVFDRFEGITETLVWADVENKEVNAVWLEDEFEFTINSTHGDIVVDVYNINDVLISNYKLYAQENTELVLKVKTTNKAVISIVANTGYIFNNWTTNVNNIQDVNSQEINIGEFLEDQTITANFDTRNNKITLIVNRTDRGILQSGEFKTTTTVDTVEIYAKTETSVDLVASPFEGYQVGKWEVEAYGEKYELSGAMTDKNRTLTDFVGDMVVTVYFEPMMVNITIISNIAKGALSIEDEIEGVESYNYGIYTESDLVFRITVNHGYSVVTQLASWEFETTSQNKGTFEVALETEGVYKITFKGFTANGTITVPFTNNIYDIKVVSVYYNETYEIDSTATRIVTLTQGENVSTLDSEQSFSGAYLSEAKLAPSLSVEGYTFACWSTEGTSTLPINALDGLLETFEDESIKIQILDDLTLYLIYTINYYTITYSLNDAVKGSLIYDDDNKEQFSLILKYGSTAKPVTASPKQYFEFKKWVSVDAEGNETDFSTDQVLSVTNINKDLLLKAIFVGVPILITINITLPETELYTTETDIDFAELDVQTSENVKVESKTQNGLLISYVISAVSGENVSFKLVEKNGYVYSYSNPYLTMSSTDLGTGPVPFSTATLYTSNSYDISMKARTNIVTLKLTGDVKGASIFEDHNNSIGIEKVEVIGEQKAIEVHVKTGGSIRSFLNIYSGYKLALNSYFSEPIPAQDVDMYVSTAYINNISSDMEIEVQIDAYVYEVTFVYNYDGAPSSFVATVKLGDWVFTPTVPTEIINPTRPKYEFMGWSMASDGLTPSTYEFNESSQIFTYEYMDFTAIEKLGFYGTTNQIASTKDGIDFEATLYGCWELLKYKVDIVLVPTSAVQNPVISFPEVFPNIEGRKVRYADNSQVVIGVSYVPDSIVDIIAPSSFEGYEYYGWSYDNEIIDISKVTEGNYSQVMGEEDIVVYLYYTLDVQVVSNGHGVVSPETAKVLYNGVIDLVAQPDQAYLFGKWVVNGVDLENSKADMELTITEPVYIEAIFLGEEINIILEQVEGATLRFLGTENTTQAIYRVGDTVKFEIVDMLYGYYNKEWAGEFEGVVINNEYVVSPNDAVKKYAKFKITLDPQTILVSYIVVGGSGGEFIIDDQGTIMANKSYLYDTSLSFNIKTQHRFEIVSLTVNGVTISNDTTTIPVNKDNNLLVNITNEIKLTFMQKLWVDIYETFSGSGTEKDPYVISNERQLAAMAYLINNEIDISDGHKIPYAKGYYMLKLDIDLDERFWQPIGTQENPFAGTFNYAECKVSNIVLDRYYDVLAEGHNGLFGYISDEAKFLTAPPDYTTTLLIILGVSAFAIAIIALIVSYIVVKRKKMKRLSTQSQIAMNKLQAQMQEEQQAESKKEDKSSDTTE